VAEVEASAREVTITTRRMTRWHAAGIHLLVSAVIALVIVWLMLAVWFRPPMFAAMGADRLLMILLAVDLVIGPLLTLIVFNTAKKSLRADLTVIAVLQVIALAYGVSVAFNARPVFMVFNVDRFDVVAAAELASEDLRKVTIADFRVPLSGPKPIAAKMPQDKSEKEAVLFSSATGGKDVHQMPQHYVPYTELAADVIKYAKPIEELKRLNAGVAKSAKATAEIDDFFRSRNLDPKVHAFLPLKARHEDMAVVIDSKSAAIQGILRVAPW
jgi:hypothetical protein